MIIEKEFDKWLVKQGRAIPPSRFSEVKELEDYHPGGDFSSYETSLTKCRDERKMSYLKLKAGAGWNKAAKKMMEALKFRHSPCATKLVAVGDAMNPNLMAGDYRLSKCEIVDAGVDNGHKILEGRFYWEPKHVAIVQEEFETISDGFLSSWRWINQRSEVIKDKSDAPLISSWRWRNEKSEEEVKTSRKWID